MNCQTQHWIHEAGYHRIGHESATMPWIANGLKGNCTFLHPEKAIQIRGLLDKLFIIEGRFSEGEAGKLEHSNYWRTC